MSDALSPGDRVLPKYGLLMYEERAELAVCKPRLAPLKSLTLQKLEDMQREVKKAPATAATK